MNLDLLFAVLLQIEGPSGDAAGPYGIRPVYVEDANRILGREEFRYPEDCKDDTRARQMMRLVIRHYENEDWTPREYLAHHRLGATGMWDLTLWTKKVREYIESGENLVAKLSENEQ